MHRKDEQCSKNCLVLSFIFFYTFYLSFFMFKLFFHSPGTPTTQSCHAFDKSEPFGLAHSELWSYPSFFADVGLRSSLIDMGWRSESVARIVWRRYDLKLRRPGQWRRLLSPCAEPPLVFLRPGAPATEEQDCQTKPHPYPCPGSASTASIAPSDVHSMVTPLFKQCKKKVWTMDVGMGVLTISWMTECLLGYTLIICWMNS